MLDLDRKYLAKISFLILFQVGGFAYAQLEKNIEENAHFWTSVNSTSRLSDKWGLVGDFHIRRENFLKDPNFYFMRVGAAYWLDDQFSFAGGVAALWSATETDVGRKYALEKRIYQQALWRNTIRNVIFLQRVRLEQRWHEVLDNETGAVDRIRYSTRLRILLSASIFVFRNNKWPKLVIANEVLIHFGNEIVYNTFDQNRLFLGFNKRLNQEWSFDIGYMHVYQQQYSGVDYYVNHTFRLFFYYTPDFRKKADTELPHYPVGGSE